MKDKVDKLDINKMVNVPNDLNNLKTKVAGLDGDKLKTAPVNLKKLSYVFSKKIVRNGV